MTETKKLMRSQDRVIAGICGGIADRLGWDSGQVRLAYVLISILSAGFPGTLVYLILWIALPEARKTQ